jgi:hypothetical protein
MIVNIRSSQGIVNLKVELDVDLKTAFWGSNALMITWEETAFRVTKMIYSEGGATTEVLWDSKQADIEYQKILSEDDIALYETKEIELPTPF